MALTDQQRADLGSIADRLAHVAAQLKHQAEPGQQPTSGQLYAAAATAAGNVLELAKLSGAVSP